ncbi:energy transducer TonB [Sphingomonas sp. MMS24-J13]|uniref:energy transducer TonB n=1 Tax=Sphingomonas sp. MMS24-J13 TaxID=3238686 RepID=UPI0038509A15
MELPGSGDPASDGMSSGRSNPYHLREMTGEKYVVARTGFLLPLLCFAGTAPALAQNPAPAFPAATADQAAALYDLCTGGGLAQLTRPDPAIKDYYRLANITDAQARDALDERCDAQRQIWIQKGADAARLAGRDATLMRALAARRAEMTKTLEAIHAPGPRPAVTLREFRLRGDDYPPQAQREAQQGASVVTYMIGTDGRIADCKATGATDLLNQTSCNIVSRRSLFAPALDMAGQPVSEQRTTTIHWSIH